VVGAAGYLESLINGESDRGPNRGGKDQKGARGKIWEQKIKKRRRDGG